MLYLSWENINNIYIADNHNFKIKMKDFPDGSNRCIITCKYNRHDFYMGYPVPKAFDEFCDFLSTNDMSFILPTNYYAVLDKRSFFDLLKQKNIIPNE